MRLKQILAYCAILLFLITACTQRNAQPNASQEQKALIVEAGKTVTFDYAAGFVNGTLFDTSIEEAAKKAGIYDTNRAYQPVVIKYGTDPILPGYAEVLLDMKEGETRNAIIPPQKAYGEIIPNSTLSLPKSEIEGKGELNVGSVITLIGPKGNKVPVFVKEIGAENITVDLNHPLAGQTIQFSVVVRKIE